MSEASLQVVPQAGSPVSKDLIVLILGWWNSKPKPRAKYVALYAAHERVFSVKQATLSTPEVVLPPLRRRAARRAIDQLNDARAAYELANGASAGEPAVGVQMMSNNGTVFYLELLKQLELSTNPADAWVTRRLAAKVMDSTPGPLTGRSYLGAFLASRPHPLIMAGFCALVLRQVVRMALKVSHGGIQSVLVRVVGTIVASRTMDAFNTWRFLGGFAKDKFMGPELYLFSKRDKLVHHEATKAMALRREAGGVDVQLEEFQDSEHVNHLNVHYDQYKDVVGRLLDKVKA